MSSIPLGASPSRAANRGRSFVIHSGATSMRPSEVERSSGGAARVLQIDPVRFQLQSGKRDPVASAEGIAVRTGTQQVVESVRDRAWGEGIHDLAGITLSDRRLRIPDIAPDLCSHADVVEHPRSASAPTPAAIAVRRSRISHSSGRPSVIGSRRRVVGDVAHRQLPEGEVVVAALKM